MKAFVIVFSGCTGFVFVCAAFVIVAQKLVAPIVKALAGV